MKSSFFIVADRGNLKAFRAEKSAMDRPPRLQLVRALNLTEGVSKILDINTDQDGRFPVGAGPASGKGGGNGRHQNSTAERHYEIEFDKRAARVLAQQISELLKEEQPAAWSFAAPSEIKNAILDALPDADRRNLTEVIPCDLVNVNTNEILEHFSQVRAA
jgi:hypothetical protein